MLADLRGFAMANPEKLREVIEIIEGYIGKEGVRKRMLADLQGFSILKLSHLKQLEKEWGKEELRKALIQYSLRYFASLFQH